MTCLMTETAQEDGGSVHLSQVNQAAQPCQVNDTN